MKLRILAAASAVVIGGVAFAVYRETRPDTAADAASSPTPGERAAPSMPTSSERANSSARSGATTSAIPRPASSSDVRTSAPAAPELPASADALARSRIQGTTSVRAEAGTG
ncbi:MAG TPA: hypothetical protein VFS15_13255, partial [Kofleriaceae bacterium]|nr:hypothetical protein [Kofleriaceae bacterium]